MDIFLDKEVLKPTFCSIALIGIHFTRPYLALLLDTTTTYERLLTVFPIVYKNLADNASETLLQTDEKVVNFIDDKRFKSALPKECLRECLSSCASEYKKEVLQLLKIVLLHLAAGFSEERSALFGFGPKAHTGTLLKISSVTDEAKRRKLNKTAIHNLNEERSAGFINYEETMLRVSFQKNDH